MVLLPALLLLATRDRSTAGRDAATKKVEQVALPPVKAGEVIAVVDSKAASFQAAAQAQSQAAQTQVALAKQECERADTLFRQGALPHAAGGAGRLFLLRRPRTVGQARARRVGRGAGRGGSGHGWRSA
jgi:hypothetical protein